MFPWTSVDGNSWCALQRRSGKRGRYSTTLGPWSLTTVRRDSELELGPPGPTVPRGNPLVAAAARGPVGSEVALGDGCSLSNMKVFKSLSI